ncbi:MAG: alpha/beta hydrolase [Pyrinomonadaceae bacterium]|nr:alpha/beta hydrolase [Pyrinomonadaceae bacterium]
MMNNQRLLHLISKSALLLAFIVLASASAAAQVWTVLGFDLKGDARDPQLADAAQLSYRYDKEQDFLWFRVSLYGLPNEQAFGINLVFDTGGDEAAKMNWWGGNKNFKFDRLVTAWVTRDANGYQGTMGVGDAAGVKAKQINNLMQNNLQIRVEGDALIIGVKRTDVTDKLKMNVIAAVGSNQQWNDDVPNAGAATIDLSAERPRQGLREIDVSRNNFEFPSDYKTLPQAKPPLIAKKGRGRQPLILVPGVYSGLTSFDGFIARNQSRYKFYIVTPPGINGTPARPAPANGPRLAELTWTRLLERDILNLIRREKMVKPMIVAERWPGTIAAMELAIEHPDEIGGVVLVGTNLVQFFPSTKDPTRKSPITSLERAVFVEESWAAKWFKYVTPETWNSNDFRPEMLSSDLSRGQKAWLEIEAAPLPVKIRYLCEFWASDVASALDRLQVPVLALIPTFDEKFLADPLNSFAKTAIIGSWDTLAPRHPKLELVKIPNARMLVLEDQPRLADETIATFVQQVGKTQAGR